MRILIIGNSAREHALAWKFNLDGEYVCSLPGNGGTFEQSENITSFPGLNSEDRLTFLKVARDWAIDLVVPGPADLIVRGLAEVFEGSGIAYFAPSRAAAAIEGFRAFAKEFMKRHNIPTAEHRCFINYEEAKAYLSTVTHRVVIKTSGVQVARGVVLPESQEEAQRELHEIMVNMKFGPDGELVVIEEFLTGDEISIHSFCDGINFISLPPCQVHKRIFDGSKGPNTRGMGVYAPADFVSDGLMAQITKDIVAPTFRGLRDDGRPFRGMLRTSIMITTSGPKVLEYSVRFGDPEAQALIPLLQSSTELAQICLSCTDGTLGDKTIAVKQAYACSVGVACEGYPGNMHKQRKGDTIFLYPPPPRVNIFHDGTVWSNGRLRTSGGRVFSVSAVRDTLKEAVKAAYQGVASISFPGMQYRRDIGSRCLGSSINEEVKPEAKQEINQEEDNDSLWGESGA